MAGEAKATIDHDEIKEWAEARGGQPATIKRTAKDGEVGVLRIDFPGYSGAGPLEPISWDEFFQKFDEKNLAFLYQDQTSSGEESRFFKLISRDSAEHKAHASPSKTAHKTDKDDEKHEAKAEHKDASKAHAKSEPKAEEKHEAKVEHKAESKTHTKSGHKADEKHESKSRSKSDKSKSHK